MMLGFHPNMLLCSFSEYKFFGRGMLFTILYTTQELVLESIILLLTCEMSFLGLNKLVKKLDKIAQQSAKMGGFKAKVRVESRASTLLPPPNPPNWAVTNSCLQTTGTTQSVETTPSSSALTTPEISPTVVSSELTSSSTTPVSTS